MPKKVRTAKGQIIDFDLLRIKQQLGDAPKPANVQARQDFIDQKLRRRVKRVKDKLAEAKKNPKKPTQPVDVKSNLEVDSAEQGKKIDEAKPQKRKIRRKK
jgi:hypothetical protein